MEEDNKKIQMSRKPGFKHTEETKKKIRLSAKRSWTPERKRKHIKQFTKMIKQKWNDTNSKFNSKETREKWSKQSKGKKAEERYKNPELYYKRIKANSFLRIHGKSYLPYPEKFDNQLKRKIRIRDNYTCRNCGTKQDNKSRKLSIHHIDYKKSNCSEDNLISLCIKCHAVTNLKHLRGLWSNVLNQIMGANI